MSEIRVAFLWHQHQPFYKDLRSGTCRMPWVRLHGTKDYYGMARLLRDAPESVRVTINLVPCLIDQLLDYAAGRTTDRHLELSAKPAEDLLPAERARILDSHFQADPDHLIRPWPRYRELFVRRRPGRRPAKHAVPEFSVGDLRDLQVWGNLAWFHRTLLGEDPLLAELVARGRGYTEEDKAALLVRQREVIASVLPLHATLAEEGRIGITASPYYHPILPLLTDMESARVAMPGVRLPADRRPLPEDAFAQLSRARERHEEVLGVAPRGLWPSEGGVSPGILPLVRRAGFTWLATDAGNLAASLGPAYTPDDGYQPWTIETGDGPLSLVFRDHDLSDRIGFDYQRTGSDEAVRDFLARLREIRRRSRGPVLVPVILDGENAWEHYDSGGIPFLTRLYGEIADAPDIEAVRLDDELRDRPPARVLPRLHSGSWIHSDFAIWIGQEEDVRAWEYLYRVRADLEKLEAAGAAPEGVAKARECLYAAEGSDWTWWYGSDHSSGFDEEFDDLYRTHLTNVYRFLGVEPPPFLRNPVPLSRRPDSVLEPVAFLNVTLDGRETSYFEWLAAGRYRLSGGGARDGAMSRATSGLLTDFRFGFDPESLFFRVDLRAGWREALAARGGNGEVAVVFRFTEPVPHVLVVKGIGSGPPGLDLDGAGAPAGGAAAFGEILEVGCPFSTLGFAAGATVSVHVELREGETLFERIPGAEAVRFPVPSPEFEATRWRV